MPFFKTIKDGPGIYIDNSYKALSENNHVVGMKAKQTQGIKIYHILHKLIKTYFKK